MARSMQREIGAMSILKAPKRGHCINAKSGPRDFAEVGTSERGAVISEADKALVEGSVPQRREQQSVVHVEPLLVAAVGPGHDV